MNGEEFYLALRVRLTRHDTVHETSKKKKYKFVEFDKKDQLKYNIGNNPKYIPKVTIIAAKQAELVNEFSREWFEKNWPKQQGHSPCNYCVLESLMHIVH